jgi:hypothetical protein
MITKFGWQSTDHWNCLSLNKLEREGAVVGAVYVAEKPRFQWGPTADHREFIGFHSRCNFEIWHSICVFFDLAYSVPFAGMLIRAFNSCAMEAPSAFASGGQQEVIQPNFVIIAEYLRKVQLKSLITSMLHLIQCQCTLALSPGRGNSGGRRSAIPEPLVSSTDWRGFPLSPGRGQG